MNKRIKGDIYWLDDWCDRFRETDVMVTGRNTCTYKVL